MSNPERPPASPRLASVDAYRGLVMFLMMAEALRLGAVSRPLSASVFWRFLAQQQTHVEWVGCVLHDLIQPSFSFLVGVALPFSIASRVAKGQSRGRMVVHALWRAFALIALGILLRSMGRPRINYTFEDTLTQIGLGYPFLFLLGFRPTREHWVAFVAILVAYWGLFAAYPLPGPDFDTTKVGVPADWPHRLEGFAAHWNKNTNPAWAFDTWFLNLFPRERPFTHNGGGYATLSFVPTLATMILGLIAGTRLRAEGTPRSKFRWLAVAGGLCLLFGGMLGSLGICPVVKRIWTPSWVLYSGGWCLWLLAAFYAVMDIGGWRRWAFPLKVIGMNSIAAYLLAHLPEKPFLEPVRRLFGQDVFGFLGAPYEPLVSGAFFLLILWLILFVMYRRKVYLRL